MKIPAVIKTYCKYCNKRTENEVKLSRKGKERAMSRGRRKYEEIKKGYGGSPRTPKKPVYKVGKRAVLILKCKVCGKKHQRVYSSRTKKQITIK
ncbi:MAG: 50S ribosomal protein L44e [Candidatus Altiarchaeota archaeon]